MGIGALEAEVLAAIGRLGSPGIRLEDARRLSPRPTADVRAALQRLVAKGRLLRLARARYYLPTADPAEAACHAWRPSYVSFLTVLADAGFTDQIPRRLDLAYAQPTIRTSDWKGLPITWHPVPPSAFSGYAPRADGALVATPAKAAADLVHRQRDFGGLLPYRRMIEEALRKRPPREVEAALEAYQDHSGTIRRLLYLRFGERPVPRSWQRPLLGNIDAHNPIPLDFRDRGKGERHGGMLNIVEATG